MSRIDDLIAEHCPAGVPFKALGEVAHYSDGRVDASGLDSSTFVGVDNLIPNAGGRYDATFPPNSARLTAFMPGDILLGNIRPYLKKIWLADRVGGCSGDVLAIRLRDGFKDQLLPSFLSLVLCADSFCRYNAQHARGGKMPRGDKEAILRYRIPLVPKTLQQEVVAILGGMKDLGTVLHAELDLRMKQRSHYRRLLLDFADRDDVEIVTLGDIGPVRMCKRVFREETTPAGDVPFYKIGTFGGQADAFISRDLYMDYRARYSFPKPGQVLISAAGTIGRTVVFDGEPAYFQDSNIVWIDNDESVVSNRYLYHLYQVADWRTDSSTIRRLYNESLTALPLPVPPHDEQERIVGILDRLDALTCDSAVGLPAEIKARQAQYEYYRDRLLTFTEAA